MMGSGQDSDGHHKVLHSEEKDEDDGICQKVLNCHTTFSLFIS